MTSSSAAIYITGSGVVSCAGKTPAALWANAQHNRTGIIDGIGKVSLDAAVENKSESDTTSALSFSLAAIEQAMKRAGWTELHEDDGIILATTTGQIPIWDKALVDFLHGEIAREDFDRAFIHQPIGTLLDAICLKLGFYGRTLLIATACTASTQAIALGSEWIQQGRVKRCLVVGAEVLCSLTLEGFKSLQLRSPTPAKPFDIERKGINLSEGAGALCLEAGDGAKKAAIARISGVGMTTDSFHMTAPEPKGRGCRDAIEAALSSSGLHLNDISWIHAHGTGSQHNDIAESNAICEVFGERMPPVTSTKGIHGHALGASGAIETALCLEAFANNQVVETSGLEKPDPEIKIRHAVGGTPTKINHILKLTLGFGGTNAAIILSRPDLEVASAAQDR